jgi:hypothetical protein
MKDLNMLIEITKRMQKQLVGAILSSWLFSTLAIIIQHREFDIAFSTVVTIVGGIVGTAAILSVYLGRIQHPAYMVEHTLRNRPFGGFQAFVSMLLTVGCFYFYYFYAKQSKEVCVLFFGAGMFLFFRTLADAASRMLTNEQQKVLWQSMTLEERRHWLLNNDPALIRRERVRLERRAKLERVKQELEELKDQFMSEEELQRRVDEEVAKVEEKEARQERRRQFFKRVRDATHPLRKRVGLVPKAETYEREMEELRLKQETNELLGWKESLHKETAVKIVNSELLPIVLEPEGLQIYTVEGIFRYFAVKERLDEAKARWYLEALNELKDPKGHFEFVAGIILPDVEMTYKAQTILEKTGITLYRYIPDQDSSRD